MEIDTKNVKIGQFLLISLTFLKTHTVAQLYGVPHGILYENEFQNPKQIFQQTISLFPEQSTLVASTLPADPHL
jgi:hypothetical protein